MGSNMYFIVCLVCTLSFYTYHSIGGQGRNILLGFLDFIIVMQMFNVPGGMFDCLYQACIRNLTCFYSLLRQVVGLETMQVDIGTLD